MRVPRPRTAGVNPTDFRAAGPGDVVLTPNGAEPVLEVQDGPYPTTEQYLTPSGTYAANQISAIPAPQVISSEASDSEWLTGLSTFHDGQWVTVPEMAVEEGANGILWEQRWPTGTRWVIEAFGDETEGLDPNVATPSEFTDEAEARRVFRRFARRYSQVPLVCDDCGRPAQSSMSGGKQGHTMLCDECRSARGKQPRKTASARIAVDEIQPGMSVRRFPGDDFLEVAQRTLDFVKRDGTKFWKITFVGGGGWDAAGDETVEVEMGALSSKTAAGDLTIRRFDRPGSLGGPYWVGLRLPDQREDPEDFTMQEVTYRYGNKRALLAALERGDAWLTGHTASKTAATVRNLIQMCVQDARRVTQGATSNSPVEYLVWNTPLVAQTEEELAAIRNVGDLADFYPSQRAHQHRDTQPDGAVVQFNVYSRSQYGKDLLGTQEYWLKGGEAYRIEWRQGAVQLTKLGGTTAGKTAARTFEFGLVRLSGGPGGWQLRMDMPSPQEGEAFVARFPKSLGLKCRPLLGTPMAEIHAWASLDSNASNQGVNETGIKRLLGLLRKLEEFGVPVRWVTEGVPDSYPTMDAFLTAVNANPGEKTPHTAAWERTVVLGGITFSMSATNNSGTRSGKIIVYADHPDSHQPNQMFDATLVWTDTEFVRGKARRLDAPYVLMVSVQKEFRRLGLATAMWHLAKEIAPTLQHSDDLTDDGRAWSQTVSKVAFTGDPIDVLARTIYEQAARVEAKVSADMRSLAQTQGGTLEGFEHRLKSQESIARKLRTKNRTTIGDALRYTIVLPDEIYAVQVQFVLDALRQKGYQEVSVENYWGTRDDYQGINTNFLVPGTDLVMELQFHTSHSLRLKEEVIHSLYEQYRLMPNSNPAKQMLFNVMTRYWDFIKVPSGAANIGTPTAHPAPSSAPVSQWAENHMVTQPQWLRAARLASRVAARSDLPLAPKGTTVTAADDYPELAEILWERPDHLQAMKVASLNAMASPSRRRIPIPLTVEALTPKDVQKMRGRAPKRVPSADESLLGMNAADVEAQVKGIHPLRRGMLKWVDRWQKERGFTWNYTNIPSPDSWCRFKSSDSQCMYPKELDEQGTAEAGYPVWIPFHRGTCWRISYKDQEACPSSEPGPNSGHRGAQPDATIPWSQGGQRMGKVAAWRDVQAKARRIRSEGHIRIISVVGNSVTAEVKGDNDTYLTTITKVPGSNQVGMWSCGCAWNTYSWARSGRWKKYEGRMCSHALGLLYEAQAQSMFGGEVHEQPATPIWRTKEPTVEQRSGPPRPWRLDVPRAAGLAASAAEHLDALARCATLERPERLPALHQAMAQLRAQAGRGGFSARVRGVVREVLSVDPRTLEATVEGLPGTVRLREFIHPKFDPTLGLVPAPSPDVLAYLFDEGTTAAKEQKPTRFSDLPMEDRRQVLFLTPDDPKPSGRWYHGTWKRLPVGTILTAGGASGREENFPETYDYNPERANKVWITTTPQRAAMWAYKVVDDTGLGRRNAPHWPYTGGEMHVYEVVPMDGPVVPDEMALDMGYGDHWCARARIVAEIDPRSARVVAKTTALPKTQKCNWCDAQATKRLLWAEGMAYIPCCDAHEQRTRDHLASEGNDVDGVKAIGSFIPRQRTVTASTGKLYHLTDKVDFRPDPKKRPQINTTIGGEMPPGIFLTPSPEGWVNGYGYWRPWVIEFDAPDLDAMEGAWREGNEVFIPAAHYDKLRMGRVMPLDGYCREEYQDWGWTESFFGTTFDTNTPITEEQQRGYHNWPGYRSPDARQMDPAWQASYKKRVKDYARKSGRGNGVYGSMASRHLDTTAPPGRGEMSGSGVFVPRPKSDGTHALRAGAGISEQWWIVGQYGQEEPIDIDGPFAYQDVAEEYADRYSQEREGMTILVTRQRGRQASLTSVAGLAITAADDPVDLPTEGFDFAGLIVKALDSGRVLMTQRTPYHGDNEGAYGKWEFPGGHLDEGETPLQGALREFGEETGLALPESWTIKGFHESGKYLAIVVVVPNEAWSVNANLLDHEVMGIGWFALDDIDGAEMIRTEVHKTDWGMVKEASAEGWREARPGLWVNLDAPGGARAVKQAEDGQFSWERIVNLWIPGIKDSGNIRSGTAPTLERAMQDALTSGVRADDAAQARYDAAMERLTKGAAGVDPRESMAFEDRLGLCYELAARYVQHNEGASLVHGSIGGPNAQMNSDGAPRIGHAWAVDADGEVFEPASGQHYSAGEFRRQFDAVGWVTYTRTEMLKLLAKHAHWGPWDDAYIATDNVWRDNFARWKSQHHGALADDGWSYTVVRSRDWVGNDATWVWDVSIRHQDRHVESLGGYATKSEAQQAAEAALARYRATPHQAASDTLTAMAAGEYRLSRPPKFAQFQEWDCALCGHETLQRPVFLEGPGGVIAAGTRCAAIALYGREDTSTQTRVRNDFDSLAYKAKQEDKMRVERAGRYAKALAAFHADNDASPELQSVRQTYWSLVRGPWGGTHKMKFPEFIQWVVDHDGLLPDERTAALHDEPEPALPYTEAEDDAQSDNPVPDVAQDYAETQPSEVTSLPSQVAPAADMVMTAALPSEASRAWLMQGSPAKDTGDIAAAAKAFLAKTALKDFSPAEQQQIIEEGVGVQAGNLDRLQLEGTHYQALASQEDDDDFALL